MSRQTELMCKISVVGMEICMILSIGFGLYQYSKHREVGILVGVFFGVLAFLMFNCFLYCYREQFKIAIAVIDAAADYYAATKRLILVSLFFFVLHMLFIGLMAVTWTFMAAKQTMVYDPEGTVANG